jgi:predicted GNAT family acetyltransferase
MQSLVYEASSFKDFKSKASEITNINNDQWLRVEMDACKRGTVLGEAWRQMEADKDLYPYWVYKTEDDDRVRVEHEALEGLVFMIGDGEGDACYPPCDWNCFIPETLILTPQGKKRIDSLNVGDIVFGGSSDKQRIETVHLNKFNGELIEIITKRGHVLCTDNHRILTIKGWTPSKNINPSDIIINIRKLHGFNSMICYIKNSYILSSYIVMSLIIKRQSCGMKTFKSNIKLRQKNINKVRRNTIVTNTFNISGIKMLKKYILKFSKWAFGNILTRRINVPSPATMQKSFIHNIRIEKRSRKFLPFRLNPQTFTRFFSFAKIGMRYFSDISTHFATLSIFPFICVYPLALYCIAAVSDWYLKVIKQSKYSSIASKVPAFTKLSERIKLNSIKFAQHNGSGAPLDSFNSRYVMLYSFFLHNKFDLVTNTNIQKYKGNIYNLDIKNDESYITDIGIVHNCRCHAEPVDGQYLKENDKQVSKGSDYLEKDDPKTGKPYVDEDFRFNPGKQGTMPNNSSYSEVFSSANKGNETLFDLPSVEKVEKLLTDAIDMSKYNNYELYDLDKDVDKARKGVSLLKDISNKDLISLAGDTPDDDMIIKKIDVGLMSQNDMRLVIKTDKYENLVTISKYGKNISYEIDHVDVLEGFKGSGLGAKMFANMLDAAENNGFETIDLTAAKGLVSGKEYNGYYTWARFGFELHPAYQEKFLMLVKTEGTNEVVRNAKSLQELMKTKEGQKLWKEKGFQYKGIFDIKKDKDYFLNYFNHKFK